MGKAKSNDFPEGQPGSMEKPGIEQGSLDDF